MAHFFVLTSKLCRYHITSMILMSYLEYHSKTNTKSECCRYVISFVHNPLRLQKLY